jgi:hypothetical protein
MLLSPPAGRAASVDDGAVPTTAPFEVADCPGYHRSRDSIQPMIAQAVGKHGWEEYLDALVAVALGGPPEILGLVNDREMARIGLLATPTDHCRALLLLAFRHRFRVE